MNTTAPSGSVAPLVSVVTPFYNTAAHLDECIRSVLSQSHEHLEYILQDNASDDGSTEIAVAWAARDTRVRYFRVDNLIAQVPNYNLALSRISADSMYCKVVQADDWIYRDCLRSMVELAERHPRVGLICSFRLVGDTVGGEGLQYGESVLPGREVARRHLLGQTFLFGSPTTGMFRSEVVRSRRPFYAEGRLHEDTESCYEVLRDWDFGFVHQILSYSRLDPSSTYGQVRHFDSGILDKLIVLHRYGPEFLTALERSGRTAEVELRYHRCLARAALMGRERQYWQFHRRGRATQGLRVAPAVFARAMAREMLSLLACPQQIAALVQSWFGHGRRARP
jgi:glycosyltransferase involved in cell wall biosynthesis